MIQSDAKNYFESLLQRNQSYRIPQPWGRYVERLKKEFNQIMEVAAFVNNQVPYDVMSILNSIVPANSVYCVDIGQNQMFAAQMLKIQQKQRFLTSGGLAPMGYALPVAIGASFGYNHKRQIIAITGDGGFHISLQALGVIAQYKLPITIIVLNNKSLGMIVQFQDMYFQSRATATTATSGYTVPDLQAITRAYGIPYAAYTGKKMKLFEQHTQCKGPQIIEIVIDKKTVVSPKLEVNMPLDKMSPRIDQDTNK